MTRARQAKQPWTCGPPGSLSSTLAGGFLAGIAAAVVLILVRFALDIGSIALLSRLLGPWHAPARTLFRSEFWVSLKAAAYPFVGERAYRPGFDAPIVLAAVSVILLFSISVGLIFAAVARGLSRMHTCLVAIPFGFAIWICDLLLVNRSLATVVEAIPSGLALAATFLWYERRLGRPPSRLDQVHR